MSEFMVKWGVRSYNREGYVNWQTDTKTYTDKDKAIEAFNYQVDSQKTRLEPFRSSVTLYEVTKVLSYEPYAKEVKQQ